MLKYKLEPLHGDRPLASEVTNLVFDTPDEALSLIKSQSLAARPAVVVTDEWRGRERRRFLNHTHEMLPHWAYPSDLFHTYYPHVAKTDPRKIAYTETPEKGMRDIQTITTLGRFLTKYSTWSQEYIAQLAKKYENLVNPRSVDFLRTPDEIVEAYITGPSSCMSYRVDRFQSPRHPACVYGYEGDTPPKGVLTLAVIRREDGNGYSALYCRMYGDAVALCSSLSRLGYTSMGDIEGVTVAAISHCDTYIMPYIDAGPDSNYGAAGVTLKGNRFEVHYTNGDYEASNTSGLLEEINQNYCEYYDEYRDEELWTVRVSAGGRTQQWCDSATSDHATYHDGLFYADDLVNTNGYGHTYLTFEDTHSYCEKSYEYWPNAEMVELPNGDFVHQSVVEDLKEAS
jgi:hypothetical protein